MDKPVLAINRWPTNAEMIADLAKLGYLRDEWLTLDTTFGQGVFWKKWRPNRLVAMDLDANKAAMAASYFALPFPDQTFDAVVNDAPYKASGTAWSFGSNHDYGIESGIDLSGRKALVLGGIPECHRVLRPGGFLLLKLQDQVYANKVRWFTDDATTLCTGLGMRKVDRLEFLSYRAQPAGRRQNHARRNHSSLLVFQK